MSEKLVSMKRPPEKMPQAYPTEAGGPEYPYGLNLSLDNDSLEKLGIESNPKVGKTLTLLARVTVTSVTENSSATEKGKETYRNVSLQITDMCLESGKKDVASKLYDGGKAEK